MSPEDDSHSVSAPREEPTAPTGASDEEEIEAARTANRFDIRRLIGGLFVLYGLILIVLGLFGSHAVKTQGRRDQHQPVDRARDARVRRADDLLGAEPAGVGDARPGLGAEPARVGYLTGCP